MREVEKIVSLRVLDMFWLEHLENMEHLRDSVRLRAYGQKDPLVEYKSEGHKMFQGLLSQIEKNIAETLMKVAIQEGPSSAAPPAMLFSQPIPARDNFPSNIKSSNHPGLPAEAQRAKVGRNDPCPCGSGKKYKKCHGAQRR